MRCSTLQAVCFSQEQALVLLAQENRLLKQRLADAERTTQWLERYFQANEAGQCTCCECVPRGGAARAAHVIAPVPRRPVSVSILSPLSTPPAAASSLPSWSRFVRKTLVLAEAKELATAAAVKQVQRACELASFATRWRARRTMLSKVLPEMQLRFEQTFRRVFSSAVVPAIKAAVKRRKRRKHRRARQRGQVKARFQLVLQQLLASPAVAKKTQQQQQQQQPPRPSAERTAKHRRPSHNAKKKHRRKAQRVRKDKGIMTTKKQFKTRKDRRLGLCFSLYFGGEGLEDFDKLAARFLIYMVMKQKCSLPEHVKQMPDRVKMFTLISYIVAARLMERGKEKVLPELVSIVVRDHDLLKSLKMKVQFHGKRQLYFAHFDRALLNSGIRSHLLQATSDETIVVMHVVCNTDITVFDIRRVPREPETTCCHDSEIAVVEHELEKSQRLLGCQPDVLVHTLRQLKASLLTY